MFSIHVFHHKVCIFYPVRMCQISKYQQQNFNMSLLFIIFILYNTFASTLSAEFIQSYFVKNEVNFEQYEVISDINCASDCSSHVNCGNYWTNMEGDKMICNLLLGKPFTCISLHQNIFNQTFYYIN